MKGYQHVACVNWLAEHAPAPYTNHSICLFLAHPRSSMVRDNLWAFCYFTEYLCVVGNSWCTRETVVQCRVMPLHHTHAALRVSLSHTSQSLTPSTSLWYIKKYQHTIRGDWMTFPNPASHITHSVGSSLRLVDTEYQWFVTSNLKYTLPEPALHVPHSASTGGWYWT